MFCQNCGCKLEDNVKFCENCGAKTADQTVKQDSGKPMSQPVQPAYQQPAQPPVQPAYQQPAQPPVQPAYQQPIQQTPYQNNMNFSSSKPKSSSGRIVVIAGAAILVVLLAVVGFVIVSGKNKAADGQKSSTIKTSSAGSTSSTKSSTATSKLNASVINVKTSTSIDPETMEAISPQKDFTPTDAEIFVTFQINNVPVGTKVLVEWVYTTSNISITNWDALTTEKSQNVQCSLSKPDSDWPVGDYEVKISIADTYVSSAVFSVK